MPVATCGDEIEKVMWYVEVPRDRGGGRMSVWCLVVCPRCYERQYKKLATVAQRIELDPRRPLPPEMMVNGSDHG